MTPRRRREAYVTPQQAAKMFADAGLPRTTRTIAILCDHGELHCIRLHPRKHNSHRRIRRDSIERYLKAKAETADREGKRQAMEVTPPTETGNR